MKHSTSTGSGVLRPNLCLCKAQRQHQKNNNNNNKDKQLTELREVQFLNMYNYGHEPIKV